MSHARTTVSPGDDIQAVLDRAGPEATVNFEEGIYRTRGGWSPHEGQELTGQNVYICLQDQTNAEFQGIFDCTRPRITIEAFTIDGNRENQDSGVMYGVRGVEDATNLTIREVTVRDIRGIGIHCQGNRSRVIGVKTTHCSEDGTKLQGVRDGLVRDGICTENRWNGVAVTNGCRDCRILQTTTRSNGENGALVLNNCQGITINHCTFASSGYHGIAVESDEEFRPCHKTVIQNSVIEGSEYNGVFLRRAPETRLHESTVRHSDEHGVSIVSSPRCRIKDSRLRNNSQQKDAGYNGIDVRTGAGSSTGAVITGNWIIESGERRCRHGIVMLPDSQGTYTIQNNQIRGVRDEPIVTSP
ncbi:right-handed parallel beta-helix repeat-containing protein [Halomarina pelagica]|uniref:right-handed parallel beta-helix repeat-containing protein n=1 Tax=Halomarina pelagica TaxID=2961599 RepID=UPI0020C1F298|nr:right-handed parallel beta-helix repeat-containing protein [Halomarina sp. BND7]